MAGHQMRHVIVYKDKFAYISHPTITTLQNGDWIAAFNHSIRHEKVAHPPHDPLYRNLLLRTSDRGETWNTPCFAPDFDWYGTECPGLAQLSDGTVILSQWLWGWYPLDLARKKKAAGEKVYLAVPGKDWRSNFDESEWADSRFPFARTDKGLFIHISDDNGRTFGETVQIDTSPYDGGYTRAPVVQLKTGRVAYILGESPQRSKVFLMFSDDGCRTWSQPHQVADTTDWGFPEPHLAELDNGELFCMIREEREQHMYSARSQDGGQTWSTPERTPMFGYPGHLLKLSDGRLICSFGRRVDPFGIRIGVSEDGGKTWLADDEIVVRADFPNRDLGYPTTIEYEPGKLFCCYYGQDTDGVTCIQGTYIEMW